MAAHESTPDGRPSGPVGFCHRPRKNGEVELWHHGRLASTLRGHDAADFLARAATLDDTGLQQLMARLTGNYKRGNERAAARHPRRG
jgi:hypothetical protein